MALWEIIPPEEVEVISATGWYGMEGMSVRQEQSPHCERCCLNDICAQII